MNELTTLHPTPWFAFLNQVADNKNQVVAETSVKGESVSVAQRIVECVNAMEGIESPQKHRETWDAIQHLELDACEKYKVQISKIESLISVFMQNLASNNKIGANEYFDFFGKFNAIIGINKGGAQ